MEDYYKYLDQTSIDEGDILFGLGFYDQALEHYLCALHQLRQYSGDRTNVINIHFAIKKKILNCQELLEERT